MIGTILKYFRFGGSKTPRLQHGMAWSVLESFFQAWQILAFAIVLDDLVKGSVDNETISAALGIMLLSIAGVFVSAHFKSVNFCDGNFSMTGEKRAAIGDHMRYLPMGYFNRTSLGDIASTMTNTLDDVQNAGGMVYTNVISGFVYSVVMAVLFICMDWRLGLVMAGTIAVVVALNALMQRSARASSAARVGAQRAIVGAILEYLQGMSVVRAFGAVGTAQRKLEGAVDACERSSFAFELKFIRYNILQNIVTKASSVALCLAAVAFWIDGTLDATVALIAIVASFMVYSKIELSGSFSSLLRQLELCMNKVDDLIATPTMDEGAGETGEGMGAAALGIELSGVKFAYEDRTVIDGVDLSVPAGSSLAIVGPSGSGKSTLAHLMCRFWDVDEGSVSVGGVNVRDWKVDDLLQRFSMVFQGTYLFDDTVENNIKFGRPEATHAEVVAAARRACCDEFIEQLPDGYRTCIGEGGKTLSGGERQRIAIARAILKDAPIVVLDEATANVDPENERDLQRAIAELCRSKTVVMIAHRLKTVRNADRIVVVDGGRIVQTGTHDELMAQDGLYRDFVNMRTQAIGWKL